MSVYKCRICGFIFDEAKEGRKISELDACPVCKQSVENFEKIAEAGESAPAAAGSAPGYDARFARKSICPDHTKKRLRLGAFKGRFNGLERAV